MNKKLLLLIITFISLNNALPIFCSDSSNMQPIEQESTINSVAWERSVKLKAFRDLLMEAKKWSELLNTAQENGDLEAETMCHAKLQEAMKAVIAAAIKYSQELSATGDPTDAAFAAKLISTADVYTKTLNEIKDGFEKNKMSQDGDA